MDLQELRFPFPALAIVEGTIALGTLNSGVGSPTDSFPGTCTKGADLCSSKVNGATPNTGGAFPLTFSSTLKLPGLVDAAAGNLMAPALAIWLARSADLSLRWLNVMSIISSNPSWLSMNCANLQASHNGSPFHASP
jgi:hypothetical protein